MGKFLKAELQRSGGGMLGTSVRGRGGGRTPVGTLGVGKNMVEGEHKSL